MNRLRNSLIVVILAVAPSLAIAQAAIVKPISDAPAKEDETPVTRLVVRPALPPRAALKYRLLPPLLDRRPGNAAVMYNKIGLTAAGKDWDETQEKLSEWLELPIGSRRFIDQPG